MDIQAFIQSLLSAAKQGGIEAAEVYLQSGDSFRAMAQQGAIANYTVNSTRGLSLRGLFEGKMGYSSTEALDEEAIGQLVEGVKESAQLCEDDAVQEIYPGDSDYPLVNDYNSALDSVPEKLKLDFLLSLEEKAKAKDPRIVQLSYNMFVTSSSSVRIANSYGMDLQHRDNIAYAYINAVAKEGERVVTGTGLGIDRDFDKLSADKIVDDAVEEALFMLGAEPVASGAYRAIIYKNCMPDILNCFSGIFSAENAQQGMSLLSGREGEIIAAPIVTIFDDPLLKGGLASQPFDAEGVKTPLHQVVENGKLVTLLHNLKTARKAGVKTTGNASKGSYSAPVKVAPSNFYFKPGEKTLDELMMDMGEGLVITEVGGLHSGADPVSGDFSLIASGYSVKDGKKNAPVDRITIAGNFYELLKNIRAVGSDLAFPGSNVGSPSVDIGEIAVAGK